MNNSNLTLPFLYSLPLPDRFVEIVIAPILESIILVPLALFNFILRQKPLKWFLKMHDDYNRNINRMILHKLATPSYQRLYREANLRAMNYFTVVVAGLALLILLIFWIFGAKSSLMFQYSKWSIVGIYTANVLFHSFVNIITPEAPLTINRYF